MRKTQAFSLPLLRRRAEEAAAGLPALMDSAEKAAAGVLAGGHDQRRPGAGEKFWQFRDYAMPDRPQDIDWRRSARGDRLFVREKEHETPQTLFFWTQADAGMDWRSAGALPTKRAAAAVLALALAILLTRAGENVAALDDAESPGHGAAALERLGRALLAQEDGAALPALSARRLPARSGLVLCGDFLDSPGAIESAMAPLAEAASHVTLFQILDPAECDPPYAGRAIFETPGGGPLVPVEHVESVRVAYRDRIESQQAAVRDLCCRNGWRWIFYRTDADVREPLHAVWSAMTRDAHRFGEGGAA